MEVPPDIVWILTTQWRAFATGYNGDRNVRTPWLDGIASEATSYDQAVSPHPSGPHARAVLYTGRNSPENGIRDYWDAIPENTRTIAHALNDRGYETSFFGKWHLSSRDRNVPLVGEAHAKVIVPLSNRGGFELWEGFESGFLLNDPWLHGSRLPKARHFKGYQSDVISERAAEWMNQPRSRPKFCVVSLEAPHPPYHAPAAGITEQDPQALFLRPNVPLGNEIEEKARSELAGYYAHIEATDRSIGAMVTEMNMGKTIIVFTSVHGDMHGSHGVFRKGWPYEESLRVPLLVRDPRRRSGANRDCSAVSLRDLPHMTVAWAEGREWKCKGERVSISMPRGSGISLQCDRSWRGYRTPLEKLVFNDDGTPWLYFDLKNDPFEMNNLVENSDCALKIERARRLLE